MADLFPVWLEIRIPYCRKAKTQGMLRQMNMSALNQQKMRQQSNEWTDLAFTSHDGLRLAARHYSARADLVEQSNANASFMPVGSGWQQL